MQIKVKFCVEKKNSLFLLSLGIFKYFSTKQLVEKISLCCNELDIFSVPECIFIRVSNGDCWLDCNELLYIEGQAAFISRQFMGL